MTRRIHARSRRRSQLGLRTVLVAVATVAGTLLAGAVPSAAASGAVMAQTPVAALINTVTQPAIIAYGSARNVLPFAYEGALVIAGRDNYNAPEMKQVSAAGGTVLVYLDTVIDNPYGRYHQMLLNSSECGAAVSRWPGNVQANNWGYLNDFRPGSTLQNKLACVLEKIVAENPHIGGFFADDLGSRSWFPNFSWSSFGAQSQLNYRNGAVALSATFRKVSDRHGLIFMVNGTWSGGTLANSGGGYPDSSRSGNALADGTLAEHHPADSYWGTDYPCAPQWATQSATTKGKAFNFAVTNTDAERAAFARTGCYAFAATQQSYDSASVWRSFSRTGLPSSVQPRSTTPTTPPVTTPPVVTSPATTPPVVTPPATTTPPVVAPPATTPPVAAAPSPFDLLLRALRMFLDYFEIVIPGING